MDKKYIELIRFESDNRLSQEDTKSLSNQIRSIKKSLLSGSLRVTQDTVPLLYDQITTCASILGLNREHIDAYIYSTPDHNAFSISHSDSTSLIAMSSSLIKILDAEELRFLIGHELGHAVFKHSELTHSSQGELDYELGRNLRRMEISADRMGYLCSSLESSITAMMKIASGLDGTFLNSDIRPFIDQSVDLGKELEKQIYESSSHPPLPLRARALVWLSTMELFDDNGLITNIRSHHREKIKIINQNIDQSISTFLDQQMENKFTSAKQFLELLLSTLHFAEDGVLSKEEQNQLINDFGQDAKRMFKLLSGSSRTEVTELLLSKLRDTFDEMLAYSFDKSYSHLQHYSEKIGISQHRILEMLNLNNTSDT